MRIQVYPVLFEEMKSSQPCSRAWAASNTHVVAHRIPRGIYENGESTRYIPKNNWTALGKMMMKWIYSGKKTTQMGVFFFLIMLFQCNKFGNKWLASRFTGILFFKQTHIDELCHDMLYCLAVGNQDSQEMISKKGSGHVIFVGCRFPEKLVTSDHS